MFDAQTSSHRVDGGVVIGVAFRGIVEVDLGVGVYTNEDGKIPLLRAVREAEQARVEAGKSLWVLRRDRDITPIAGRYLVVVDSARKTRPAWSPMPGRNAWSKVPKGGDTAD